MSRSSLLTLALLAASGCQLAQLPDGLFLCEADGTCPQAGFGCAADLVCRPVDGGSGDGGLDAGVDAGLDSGVDAGLDAGVDAGLDAGVDAGLDAGVDAGLDAGVDAGIDAGCAAFDLPDDNGLDTNCDGIDGDRSIAAFVAPGGNDLNPGTDALPFRTISRALLSGKAQILVAAGTYAENLSFGNARLWGGYNADAGWARDAGAPLILGQVSIDGDGGLVTLDLLDFTSSAATDAGAASVALTLRNVGSEAVLRRLVITAAAAGGGLDGSMGLVGASGNPGASGLDGPVGSDGGPGGAATDCGGSFAGAGFVGGFGARALPGAGGRGEDSTFGGDGGAVILCVGGPCTGLTGGPGLVDLAPDGGSPGDAGSRFGALAGLTWVPATGSPGTRGGHGPGGGGGGGGGGFLNMVGAFFGFGGGGGGGGSGGCGGLGGAGGLGGGASIGVLLIDASPTIFGVSITTGAGGTGGSGGPGGPGGNPGPGGPGGGGTPAGNVIAGAGGTGAAGRSGATGGPGGGGAGGPAIGLWCFGTSAPTQAAISFTSGAAGAGGSPNGQPGVLADVQSCP